MEAQTQGFGDFRGMHEVAAMSQAQIRTQQTETRHAAMSNT